jgi:hypothetical protein
LFLRLLGIIATQSYYFVNTNPHTEHNEKSDHAS